MQTSWRATGRTITNVTGARLRIAHLYADEMNIYGDRGNILALSKRAEWRGIPVEVRTIERGPAPDLSEIDLIFWGGWAKCYEAPVTTARTALREWSTAMCSAPTCMGRCCPKTRISPTC